MVRKKNGDWRPCGDYRAVNAAMIPDRYLIPLLEDFASNLAGCKVFSTIDLIWAFHQIPVEPADIPKTAVTTPFGLFEYMRMPFGLRNTAQTFQRFMDTVCRGLDFVFVYIDNILVFSHTPEEHAKHLEALFERLDAYGVIINPAKSVFGQSEVDFLGLRVSAVGSKPLPNKVDTICNFPQPTTTKGLLKFLGIVNFYRRWLPKAAEVEAPLYDLLTTTKKDLTWTPEATTAFKSTKQAVVDATLLAHPLRDGRLALFVDASDTGLGAALNQLYGGAWQPLGFCSNKLESA